MVQTPGEKPIEHLRLVSEGHIVSENQDAGAPEDKSAEEQMAEPEDPWKSIGGGSSGNTLTDSMLIGIGQQLADKVFELDQVKNKEGDDLNKVKLLNGVMFIAQMAAHNCRDISQFIGIVAPPEQKNTQASRERIIIVHDSLELLKTAYLTRVEFFHNYKSVLWETPEAVKKTLGALNQTTQLIAELTSPDPKSIEGFITKTQVRLLESAGIPPLRKSASHQQKAGRQRTINNLRAIAWKDFHELPPVSTVNASPGGSSNKVGEVIVLIPKDE